MRPFKHAIARSLLLSVAIATMAASSVLAGPMAGTKQGAAVPGSYGAAVTAWEAFKAAQPAACSAAVDSTQHLTGRRTGTVVLVLHGYAGNPAQMQPLMDMFGTDVNIIAPRLAGHFDQNMDALDDATFDQWIAQAQQSLAIAQALGDRVIVAGYSLGGLLASRLALESPDAIDRLVLLAPAWKLQPRAVVESDLGALLGIRRSSLGDTQICEVDHFDLSARGAVEVHRLAQEVERTYRQGGTSAFALISHPILISVGGTDQIVDTPYVLAQLPDEHPVVHLVEDPTEGHLWYMQSQDLYRTGNAIGDAFVGQFRTFVAQ
ncbi:MAG: alpha/beta fold hydrolase [Bauldia sp.]|nr:alpha/beta fold hydrolase [Bauldia sp.]